VITIQQRYRQTDGQTDGQTTYHGNIVLHYASHGNESHDKLCDLGDVVVPIGDVMVPIL